VPTIQRVQPEPIPPASWLPCERCDMLTPRDCCHVCTHEQAGLPLNYMTQAALYFIRHAYGALPKRQGRGRWQRVKQGGEVATTELEVTGTYASAAIR
jgi:hypothetical protein